MVYWLCLVLCVTAMTDGSKACFAYDVTTDADKDKNGNDLTALQVTFNGMQWYIIKDESTAENAGTVTLPAADGSFGTSAFDNTDPYYTLPDSVFFVVKE